LTFSPLVATARWLPMQRAFSSRQLISATFVAAFQGSKDFPWWLGRFATPPP
jgi:hypothetical protein